MCHIFLDIFLDVLLYYLNHLVILYLYYQLNLFYPKIYCIFLLLYLQGHLYVSQLDIFDILQIFHYLFLFYLLIHMYIYVLKVNLFLAHLLFLENNQMYIFQELFLLFFLFLFLAFFLLFHFFYFYFLFLHLHLQQFQVQFYLIYLYVQFFGIILILLFQIYKIV